MAIMDFGRIASILKDSANNNANRDVLASFSDRVSTADHNFSTGITSIVNSQIILGIPNSFLWSSHTWDDAINTVA